MEAKEERYEFSFDEQINNGGKEELKGFVFDVCPKGGDPMTSKKPQIILQSEDKGEGHIPFGCIEFKDIDNLKLAQIGLEILSEAISRDIDLKN